MIVLNRSIRKRTGKQLKKFLPIYVIFLPVLLYFAIFSYAPMVGTIIAFKDYSFLGGLFGSPWVGFKHFARFLSNGDFWLVFRNTVIISFWRVLFGFPVPILFALLLNELKHDKFKRVVQTAAYLPHFISWVVVYGILYNLFSTNGIINQLTALFGAEPVSYLARQEYFRRLYVGSAVWKETGWSAIIYIAALSGIDSQLYEAGMLDGANRWQKIWYITLPSIRSTISIMFVLGLGNILNVGFEQILVMYNSSVSEVAEVIDYYIYRVGVLQVNNYSYATAVGLFRSVFCMLLVIMTNCIANKIDEESAIW